MNCNKKVFLLILFCFSAENLNQRRTKVFVQLHDMLHFWLDLQLPNYGDAQNYSATDDNSRPLDTLANCCKVKDSHREDTDWGL